MSLDIKTFLISIGVVGIATLGFLLITQPNLVEFESTSRTEDVINATKVPENNAETALASTTPPGPAIADKTKSHNAENIPITAKNEEKPAQKEVMKTPVSPEIVRVQDPYSTPPLAFSAINEETRAALVNILCAPRSGSLRPVSGSGVIIDPRGVILTNAHVAQYVLLASDARIDLSCAVRSGSPARPLWTAEVLYIPQIWVKEHADELNTAHPLGTGEHDYALLRINSALGNSQFPASFPSIAPDVREAIGFVNDPVLVASYPAEFIGGIAAQLDFYPVSSITKIKKLLTFNVKTVDVISIGGVIEAQSGSSGGALVNAWGRLIGIVTTTSEGTTTAQRDLRSVTLSYIDRDITAQTGFDLSNILGKDIASEASDFNANEAPELIRLLVDKLPKR